MAKEHGARVDFSGFPAPTSNTTYTPNQFFDVLLRHSKNRGEVRFVAYLIRKTLGWCDADGNPQETEIFCSHRELIEKAGISRGAITQAIADAVEHGFVECVREGTPNLSGKQSVSSLYRLRFEEAAYTKRLEDFRGFFAGEGNRTFIPNTYFDVLIPQESIAVIKVVGAIIRHTIGWQNKYGFRRQKVTLSVRNLKRLTGLANRATAEAIKVALQAGYIRKVQQGCFDLSSQQNNESNVFAIRWEDSDHFDLQSTEVTENKELEGDGSKRSTGAQNGTVQKGVPDERFNKENRTVQKGAPERFNKEGRIKRTPLKRKPTKTTTVTEGTPEGLPGSVVALSNLVSKELQQRGVSARQADKIVAEHPASSIERQIEAFDWRLEHGHDIPNPGGFLREAIIGAWEMPSEFKSRAELAQEAAEKTARKEAREEKRRREETLRQAKEAEDLAEYERQQALADEFMENLSSLEREHLEKTALEQFPNLTGTMRKAVITNHVIELIGDKKVASDHPSCQDDIILMPFIGGQPR